MMFWLQRELPLTKMVSGHLKEVSSPLLRTLEITELLQKDSLPEATTLWKPKRLQILYWMLPPMQASLPLMQMAMEK